MSQWTKTSIKAKEIEGRAHIWHQGYWAQLNIPTFVRGSVLMVREDFFTSEEDLLANNVKGYYDDAGKTQWVETGVQGTKMGDTKYAMVDSDWVPLNIPAYICPRTNTVWVPKEHLDKI